MIPEIVTVTVPGALALLAAPELSVAVYVNVTSRVSPSARFWKFDPGLDAYKEHQLLMTVESLERQIKDAQIFEKAQLVSCGTLSTAGCVDIAQVFVERGDVGNDKSDALCILFVISQEIPFFSRISP